MSGKPNPVKILLKGVHRDMINAAVQYIDVGTVISQLLKSKREIIRFSGGLVHAHTRDPRLMALSNEASADLAEAYDRVLAKLAIPVLNAAQDGLQNQKESNRTPLPALVASEGS
jgi:hypothetical protein